MPQAGRNRRFTRRHALQALASAGALAALPRTLRAAAGASPGRASGRKLGVALVGLGTYSTDLLAPALQLTRHCRLAGIVTGTPSKVDTWQRKYAIPDRNVYDYDNLGTIADNDDIDVVYVVTPNHLHKPLVLRVAAAGKHVWCEKPMAMNAAEAEAMIKACSDHRVRLAIGYRMRHEPNTRRLMAMADERPYGRIVQVRADAGFLGWRDGHDDAWRIDPARGGGAMYDMGVYALQGARYGTGLEPEWISARSEVLRPDVFRGVDETMRFTLDFPGGVQGHCVTSFAQNVNLLHMDCERGWYELSPFLSYEGNAGRASDGTVFAPQLGKAPRLQARQMDDDALAIMQGTELIAPGEEGLRDMRVLDAAFASARKDGERVRIARA